MHELKYLPLKSVTRLILVVAGSWLALTTTLYGLSAALNNDVFVFLTGGSRNLALVFFINFVVLATAWGAPLVFRMHSDVSAVKGRAPVYIILQVAVLFLLLVAFYVFMNRVLFGFVPYGVDIQMTPDYQKALVTRMAVFVGAAGFGTLLGLAILFPRVFREPEITFVSSDDIEGR